LTGLCEGHCVVVDPSNSGGKPDGVNSAKGAEKRAENSPQRRFLVEWELDHLAN
jgi:hypothetical protein